MHHNKHVMSVIAATLIAALSVGFWAFGAAPAGASAAFTPQLDPSVTETAKVAQTDGTTNQLAQVTAKRTTPIRAAVSAAGSSVRSRRGSTGSELSKARALLAAQIAAHPILKGTTVEFGDARGYQAIALYQSGRIIISPSHSASLERIITHEVWHVIDWRDNGRIDWGENVPR